MHVLIVMHWVQYKVDDDFISLRFYRQKKIRVCLRFQNNNINFSQLNLCAQVVANNNLDSRSKKFLH